MGAFEGTLSQILIAAMFIPVVMDIKTDQQLSDVYAIAQFRKIKVR
jgi:hypothetical protein